MANSVRSFWAGRDLLSASNRLPDRHSGVKGSRKRSRACGSELRVCGWVGRYCRVKCSSIEILRFLPFFLVWQIIVFRYWSQLGSTVSRLRLGKITVSKYNILSRLGKSLSPDLITDWQITVPRSYHGLANRCPQFLSRLGKSLSPDPITAWQIAVPRSYHGLANHCPQILSRIGKSLSQDKTVEPATTLTCSCEGLRQIQRCIDVMVWGKYTDVCATVWGK